MLSRMGRVGMCFEQTSADGTPMDIGQATAADIGDADVAITNDASGRR